MNQNLKNQNFSILTFIHKLFFLSLYSITKLHTASLSFHFFSTGAVALGFRYCHGTRLAFICSHLAARVQRISHRASDYRDITARVKKLAIFNSGCNTDSMDNEGENLNKKLNNMPLDAYDHVFWLGDVNYRIHMSNGPGCDTIQEYKQVQTLIQNKKWNVLQTHDQLKKGMEAHQIFCGYQEEDILFPPTYRMNKNKNGYSNKRNQAASWTDRILYHSQTPVLNQAITPRLYDSNHSMKQSDHRPVVLQIT